MKTFVSSIAGVLGLVLVAGAPAHAQHNHSGHTMAPQAMAAPSTAAFQQANEKMHESMDIAYSGNADVDSVRGMIPHHQGAIDMAKVVLAYGKDPKLKKLAQDIIAAQEKEIAEMQAWLKANAK